MSDEKSFNIAEDNSCSSKTSKCRWWAVDDMLSVDHRKRVIATIRHERIARTQHHDLLRHGWS